MLSAVRGKLTTSFSPWKKTSYMGARLFSGKVGIADMPWPERRVAINSIFAHLVREPSVRTRIKEMNIDSRNWNAFANSYRRNIIKAPEALLTNAEELRTVENAIQRVLNGPEAETVKDSAEIVFSCMLKRAEQDLKLVIMANATLSKAEYMTSPKQWFPLARMMKRKIIYHGGPTNSGKTYHAIERLKNVDRSKGGGIYCGPLRLLALEVYDKLNRLGVPTNLRTGQETRMVPGACHTASTVEMVSTTDIYDVAVVDEIQMIGDPHRGSAWTRALLGLRANEIHVCGGLEAADLVRQLCESTGDEFILRKYERLSPIEVEPESLQGDYSKVQPGDCVVAFTVQDLFLIRREIESKTPYKCAIINGKLPSETKSSQAKLFNEPGTGTDILIATDAIGMGLNLNIRRIIFHSTLKRGQSSAPADAIDGTQKQQYHADPILVKQIAGRAGRKSSDFNVGKVTTWQEFDLAYVRAVVEWDIPQIPSAGLSPDLAQIHMFYEHLKRLMPAAAAEEAPTTDAAAAVVDVDAEQAKLHLTEGEEVREVRALLSTTGADTSDGAIVDAVLVEDEETAVAASSAVTATAKKQKQKKAKQGVDEYDAAAATDEASLEENILNASTLDSIRLSLLVERFLDAASMDSRYFLCNQDSFYMVSNFLQPIPMTIDDRFTFASAPTNIRSPFTMETFYRYAALHALNRPVLIGFSLKRLEPKTLEDFTLLCEKHSAIDLYLWLAAHFPKSFIDYDNAMSMKTFAVQMIETYLSTAWETIDLGDRRSAWTPQLRDKLLAKAVTDSRNVLAKRYLEVQRKLTAQSHRDNSSHGAEYMESVLPPFAPELRELTRSHLNRIPKKLYFVAPTKARGEDGDKGDANNGIDAAGGDAGVAFDGEVQRL